MKGDDSMKEIEALKKELFKEQGGVCERCKLMTTYDDMRVIRMMYEPPRYKLLCNICAEKVDMP